MWRRGPEKSLLCISEIEEKGGFCLPDPSFRQFRQWRIAKEMS